MNIPDPQLRAKLLEVSARYPYQDEHDTDDKRRYAAGLLATMLLRIERDQMPNPAEVAAKDVAYMEHFACSDDGLLHVNAAAMKAMAQILVADPTIRRNFGV